MAEMVGGVFGLTVKTKFVDAVSAPSLTVTVMVDVPLPPATGVMTTFRFAPLPPPKVILASGTRVVFDEVPETVNPLGCVSASPIVKPMGELGVSSFVDWSPIADIVGGAFTVNTKFTEVLSVPSPTVMVMVAVPLSSAAGVITTLRPLPLPPKTMLPSGTNVVFDDVAESVRPLGWVSASPIVKAMGDVGVFSFVDWSAIEVIVGGMLSLTVNTKFTEVLSVPSPTVMVMVVVPNSSVAGVITKLRPLPLPPKMMLPSGANVVFDEVAESVRPLGWVSASPIVKAMGDVGVFSFVDWSAIEVIVGGMLSLTVNTKFTAVLSVPSLTVMVMVVVPLSPGVGVITTLRSASVPLNAISTSETNVAFDEIADSVNALG